MQPSTVTIRAIEEGSDPAIGAFGRLQDRSYFAPEMLIPARYIGQMLRGSGERENHLLVAEDAGQVVGGVLFHYLRPVNAGFSSFMAVAPERRGQGIARQLHDARLATLDRVAGQPVRGVFIDVVSPERLSDRDRAREEKVGSDPAARRRAFAALGFRRVDVRYEQPVGGPNGGPVTDLDLLYCPRGPATEVDADFVAATLREYWRGWLGEEAASRHSRALRQRMPGSTAALLDP